jgi:hypothetical protein
VSPPQALRREGYLFLAGLSAVLVVNLQGGLLVRGLEDSGAEAEPVPVTPVAEVAGVATAGAPEVTGRIPIT